MLPVSPSLVGTVIEEGATSTAASGEQITDITAKDCRQVGVDGEKMSGEPCPIGIKVPLNFTSGYEMYFGRAARPGEQYESTGSAFAPAEALHGMTYIIGQPLSTVLTDLGTRHLTATLRLPQGESSPTDSPGPWYVWGAEPLAPGKVLLWVGHTKPATATPDPNDAK